MHRLRQRSRLRAPVLSSGGTAPFRGQARHPGGPGGPWMASLSAPALADRMTVGWPSRRPWRALDVCAVGSAVTPVPAALAGLGRFTRCMLAKRMAGVQVRSAGSPPGPGGSAASQTSKVPVVVYLLHFDRPYRGSSQHYVGCTRDLDHRLEAHRIGDPGTATTYLAHKRGIGFVVARIWVPGSWLLERQIKRRGPANSCPLCPRKRRS